MKDKLIINPRIDEVFDLDGGPESSMKKLSKAMRKVVKKERDITRKLARAFKTQAREMYEWCALGH